MKNIGPKERCRLALAHCEWLLKELQIAPPDFEAHLRMRESDSGYSLVLTVRDKDSLTVLDESATIVPENVDPFSRPSREVATLLDAIVSGLIVRHFRIRFDWREQSRDIAGAAAVTSALADLDAA